MSRFGDEPTIEELAAGPPGTDDRYGVEVPERIGRRPTVSRLSIDARLVALLVGLTIVVTAAVTGRLEEMPAAASSARAVTTAPPARLSAASTRSEAAESGLAVIAPRAGELVRGATVSVQGTATRDLGKVRIRVMIGDTDVGDLIVGVARGPLTASVRVFAPRSALPAQLQLMSVGARARPILEIPFRSEASEPVGVWSVAADRASDGCEVEATGPAPLTVEPMLISVDDGSGARAGMRSAVRAADTPGSQLFGEGVWWARLPVEPKAPVAAASAASRTLEIRWTDPSDGTRGTMSIPFEACR